MTEQLHAPAAPPIRTINTRSKGIFMRSGMRRIAATVAATTLVGGLALAAAPAGLADAGDPQIGTAKIVPGIGTDADTPTIDTSGVCPDAAPNSQVMLFGSGFPADGYNVSANNSNTILPPDSAGGYAVSFIDSLVNIAQQQMPPATYSGLYTVKLVCLDRFANGGFGEFSTTMTFADAHHYAAAGTEVATTTVLTASPAGSATAGASVTLTATVGPSGAAGSVQFRDGTTALGTAPVTGTVATLTTTALAAGNHSLTAVFTPTAPVGATPSTSAALSYAVTAPVAVAVAAVPVLSRPSALVLTVGTTFSCPDGAKETVPASAVGQADSCTAGGPYIVGAKGVEPVALIKPSLSGTGKVGTKFTLKPGFWTPAYTSRTVIWKRDGKVIAKASGGTYTVTKTDKGHKISATVTAHLAGHLDGTASTSSAKAKGIVAGATLSGASLADIADTTANAKPISVPVGSIIGCAAGAFTGATTTTSAWFIDGTQASTDPVLILGDKAVGHFVVCRTTGTNAGGTVLSDASITVVPGAALLAYVQPRVVGIAKVGKKLTAIPGKWNPTSAKASFVWLRNGKAIKGATKATYVLTALDKKHKISVRVTATRPGWGIGKAVSVAVSVG